jgi:hypothetical protein
MSDTDSLRQAIFEEEARLVRIEKERAESESDQQKKSTEKITALEKLDLALFRVSRVVRIV